MNSLPLRLWGLCDNSPRKAMQMTKHAEWSLRQYTQVLKSKLISDAPPTFRMVETTEITIPFSASCCPHLPYHVTIRTLTRQPGCLYTYNEVQADSLTRIVHTIITIMSAQHGGVCCRPTYLVPQFETSLSFLT